MITNVYQESCCDECREIIHNHFDCPICIIENSKRRGYQGTDQYTYISNDIAEIECEDCHNIFKRVDEYKDWYSNDLEIKLTDALHREDVLNKLGIE